MPSHRRQRKLWILESETADFFPSWCAFDAKTSMWIMHVHGWVYQQSPSSKIRAAIMHWLCRMLGMSAADFATPLFQERSRPFLVSNEKGKKLSVRLGDFVFPLGKSASSGHFEGLIKLSADEMAALRTEVDGAPFVPFEAVMPPSDERKIIGGARIIAPTGLSIVSDIDDTIKHSEVASRRKLFANTLIRDFSPIPGMADVYNGWSKQGAEFHYVSTSPWQLYKPLAAFMDMYQFPRGTMHLKAMRWKNTGLLRLLLSPKSVKKRLIRPLLDAMPGRKFLFVGDSGQRDPELYGSLGRKYPKQFAGALIRNVTGEPPDNQRFQKAFRGIPPESYRVFSDPQEVADFPVAELAPRV